MNESISSPPNGVALQISQHGIPAQGPTSFSTVSAEAFREAMRGFASTVTIVSTELGGESYGMVATAVVSVSLAPPLLMVAVQHGASSHDPIRRRGAFCVNVLARDQQEIAACFLAQREERFKHGMWARTDGIKGDVSGLPYLLDAQSVLICAVDEALPSRTHTLFIGCVESIKHGPAIAPLLYCNGAFGGFSMRGLTRPLMRKPRQYLGGNHVKT